MSNTINVRTTGWGNPACETKEWVKERYDEDWQGNEVYIDIEKPTLRCRPVRSCSKSDYCAACGKNLNLQVIYGQDQD